MAKFTKLIELKAADKISAAFDRISRKLKPMTKGVRRAAFSFDQLQKRTAKLRRSLKSAGSAMSGFGRDMSMRVSAPLLGFGAAALFATNNFQKSMNKVEALTGATADEMASMEKMARELGKTTQFSAKQAADGMAFLGMAGFNTNQILTATPKLLSLAAAGELELAQAADIATNVMGAFGLQAKDIGMISDVLAKTAASSNTSVEQLAEAMKFAAPVAREFGLDISEASSAVGLLGNIGIQGTLAGTSLKNMFTKLSAPSANARKILKSFNVEVDDGKGGMRAFSDIMADFSVGLNKVSKQSTKLAIINEVFGLRALAGGANFVRLAQQIDKNGTNKIQKFANAIKDSTGAADKMAKTLLKGLPGAIVRLQSTFEGLLLTMGIEGGFGGLMEKLINKLTEFLRYLQTLSPTTIKFGLAIGAAVIALGPLLFLFGGFLSMASNAIILFNGLTAAGFSVGAMFAGLSGAFSTLGTGIATVIGGISLPIAGAIAAVLGLATAGVVLYKKWDKVKAFFSNLNIGEKISGFADTAKNKLQSAFSFLPGIDAPNVSVGSGPGDLIQGAGNKTETTNNARVQVDFSNMPKGTQVKQSGDAPLDLSLGFAGAF